MDEDEWQISTSPPSMIAQMFSISGKGGPDDYYPPIISDRILRLFVCACARVGWNYLEFKHKSIIVASEEYASKLISYVELSKIFSGVRCTTPNGLTREAQILATWCGSTRPLTGLEQQYNHLPLILNPLLQANLLRDIVGNPFRLAIKRSDLSHYPAGEKYTNFNEAWLTPQVIVLAEAAYMERSKSRQCWDCLGRGTHLGAAPDRENPVCVRCNGQKTLHDAILDPVRLQILADALEEEGCDNQVILTHLRSLAFNHVRGCYVLDTILGLR